MAVRAKRDEQDIFRGRKSKLLSAKGQTYVVQVNWHYDEDASTSTLQIKKIKTLKSIEVEKT